MRKVLALVLAVFIFGGSALAFAWWDQLTDEDTITIGVGEGVTVTATTSDVLTGQLVPEGVILKSGDATEAVFQYTVGLEETVSFEAGEELDLTVTIDNIVVTGGTTLTQTQLEELILIVPTAGPFTLNGTDNVTIDITVTLEAPTAGNEANYQDIIGKVITFDVTFTASQTIVE